MGGARNSFCVVVLADHGGLAAQGTGDRRLASLECINHVHLQRREGKARDEEKKEGRVRKKREQKREREGERPRRQKNQRVRADSFVITERENEKPSKK